MSSRLPTSRFSRSASSWIVSTSSRRRLGRKRRGPASSVLVAPGDRRERRAQVVRHGRQQRAADPLGLRLQLRAPAPRPRGSSARAPSAIWLAKVSRSCRRSESSGRPARTDAEHADGAAGAQERQEQRDAAGEGGGAEPGALGVVETHCATEALSGRGRTRASPATRPSSRPVPVREEDRDLAPRRPRRGAGPRPAAPRTSPPALAQLAAHRVERRRAPLARPGGVGLVADARRQVR